MQAMSDERSLRGSAQVSPLQGLVSGPAGWRLAMWTRRLDEIRAIGETLRDKSDAELRKESLSLRYRAKSGEKPQKLLPTAFALVRESASRTLQMRHFDVQLLGGMAMFHGCIAEMETGEGKTLTATLAMYLRALIGKGTLLATVNDYLAQRDAEWMRPVYELLAMNVGVIQTEMDREQRRRAYACDITYGTAKEFGFDFLRDRLLIRRLQLENADVFGTPGEAAAGADSPVQREPHFALVDEADSVLIDDARTPLIISSINADSEQVEAAYRWSAEHAHLFIEDEDFEYDHDKRKVELTGEGRHRVRTLPHPDEMNGVGLIDAYDFVERAIKVERDYHRDQHYVVNEEGEIVIVDESTGRLAEGRKWRDGIHQAIEAKEHLEVTLETGQGGADHRTRLFYALRSLGWHDRYRYHLGTRVPQGLQDAGRQDPHEPTESAASAEPCRDRHQRRTVGIDRPRDPGATPGRSPRLGRNTHHREV